MDNRNYQNQNINNKAAPKVVVKETDMSNDLATKVTNKAQELLENHDTEKAVAIMLKQHFETDDTVWHCFVGRKFGSYVTHEAQHYIYFYIGQTAFLLFKTG